MPTVDCSTQMKIAPAAVCNEIYSNTFDTFDGEATVHRAETLVRSGHATKTNCRLQPDFVNVHVLGFAGLFLGLERVPFFGVKSIEFSWHQCVKFLLGPSPTSPRFACQISWSQAAFTAQCRRAGSVEIRSQKVKKNIDRMGRLFLVGMNWGFFC